MLKLGLPVEAVSRLDTMISSGLIGIAITRSELVGVSVS